VECIALTRAISLSYQCRPMHAMDMYARLLRVRCWLVLSLPFALNGSFDNDIGQHRLRTLALRKSTPLFTGPVLCPGPPLYGWIYMDDTLPFALALAPLFTGPVLCPGPLMTPAPPTRSRPLACSALDSPNLGVGDLPMLVPEFKSDPFCRE
jgi:hypothetical protein